MICQTKTVDKVFFVQLHLWRRLATYERVGVFTPTNVG